MPAEKPAVIQDTICRLPPLNYSILIGAILPEISRVKQEYLPVLARRHTERGSWDEYWTTGTEVGVICVEHVTVRWTEVVHYLQIWCAQVEQTVSKALTLRDSFRMPRLNINVAI